MPHIPEYTRAGPDDVSLSSSDRKTQLQNLLRPDNTSTFEPTISGKNAFNDDICKHCGFLRHQHSSAGCRTVFDRYGRLGMGWSEDGSAMRECDDSSNYLHPAFLFKTRRGSVGWMAYVGSRDVDATIELEGYDIDFIRAWEQFKERYTINSVTTGGLSAGRSARSFGSSGGCAQPLRLSPRRSPQPSRLSPRRSPQRRSPRNRRVH